MKGNEKIIEKINDLLADELTAINQYIVHSEMCNNWGYEILHKMDEKRAIDEMKHAEKLIARILFLEGRPIVSHLKKINISTILCLNKGGLYQFGKHYKNRSRIAYKRILYALCYEYNIR